MKRIALFLSLVIAFTSRGQIAADLNFRYSEVNLPQLMKRVQQGGKDFIILDVRTRGEYHDTLSNGKHLNIGHIKGAINIPLQELQQKPEALNSLQEYKDKEIYVLCSHSYRSRTISKLLLQNGFTQVTNVRGGMSEWYRNYDELKSYRGLLENEIAYNNLSPSELFQELKRGQEYVFIGFINQPRQAFDSLLIDYFSQFPNFRNAVYFTSADSARALQTARDATGKPIIFFNTASMGGAEMAEWAANNGIKNVNFLTGNLAGFYEYILNYQPDAKLSNYLVEQGAIKFQTPISLCRAIEKNKILQFVDLRPDTLFNRPTNGTKLTYTRLGNAINFPYTFSTETFEQRFPDKKIEYVFLPHQGYRGLELAKTLVKKGYNINWLMGGNERWEWYTNNVEDFACKSELK